MSRIQFPKYFQPVLIARYLVISILIALLFSPPLTNLFELVLFGMFISIAELRKRMLIALTQPLVIATLLFYLLILLDTSYGVDTMQVGLGSVWGWRKILLLPIAVALFNETYWKEKLAMSFVKVTTICAILSFIGSALAFAIYKYPAGIIIRNHATQGIVFSVAAFTAGMFLLLNFNAMSRLQKWAFTSSALLLICNVVYITPGRSGYLALIALGLTTAFAYAYINKKIVVPLIILMLIPMLLLSSPTVRQRISQGVSETEHYKTKAEATSMGLRMALWSNTIELIRERPVLGYGSGSFEKAYSAKIAMDPAWEKTITHDPHNQFLKITAEQGIIGLIVFFAMIMSAFLQKPSFLFYILGLGVLITWCGNSLFSSHFSTFSEGRFIFLWCGVMLANEVSLGKSE